MKKNTRFFIIVGFFLLFVLYGIFEGVKLYQGPSLTLNTPSYATVTGPLFTVSGVVKRSAYLTLNDRQIFADTKGYFEDKLLLSPGYNIIEVEVKDRFEKQVSKKIHVWYSN